MRNKPKTASALKYISFFLVLALLPISLFGCDGDGYDTKTVYAFNTVIELKIPKTDRSAALLSECEKKITEYESIFSAYEVGSELALLNENSGKAATLSPDLYRAVYSALALAKKTNGAFDPTVGRLVDLWAISDPDAPIPTASDLSVALEKVGWYRVTLADGLFFAESGVKLDLGGIAKGYVAQKISELLLENDVEYGVLSFGGNIAVLGKKPDGSDFKIGIKNPAGGTFGSLALKTGDGGEPIFVSVTGTYERYKTVSGVTYHHIIDPKTGYPVSNGLVSVAVASDNGAWADALSTALFVMGYEDAVKFHAESGIDFEAVFSFEDGRVVATDGCEFSPS